MTMLQFKSGHIEVGTGGIWVRQDDDTILIERDELQSFFEALDAARDEVFPPGPIEIPDPTRFEPIYARVNEAQKADFSPQEARAAAMQISASIGNMIQGQKRAS